jgi:hypothetical protein
MHLMLFYSDVVMNSWLVYWLSSHILSICPMHINEIGNVTCGQLTGYYYDLIGMIGLQHPLL